MSLRTEILEKRKALSSDQVEEKSLYLCKKFISFFEKNLSTKKIKNIALYRFHLNEVKLDFLFDYFKKMNLNIFYPKLIGHEIQMKLCDLKEASHWEEGSFKINEPLMNLPTADPKLLDLILVPGVAFGAQGQRLGYGKGFYDRFLAQTPQALKGALLYDFQWIEEGEPIPQNSWDVPMNFLVSESKEFVGILKK